MPSDVVSLLTADHEDHEIMELGPCEWEEEELRTNLCAGYSLQYPVRGEEAEIYEAAVKRQPFANEIKSQGMRDMEIRGS